MANPNEPTLTCSEVVERLRCQVIHVDYAKGTSCIDKRSEAMDHPERYAADFREELIAKKHYCNDCYAIDQIEWRERRVQELENCLGEIALTLKVGHGVGAAEQCRLYAENTLANSEQIRKGAKHE